MEGKNLLLKKTKTFIISTIDKEGYPITKAVVKPKIIESQKELYFATNTSSNFVQAIKENKKASVYFYKRGIIKWQGVLLQGTMQIIEDLTVKEKYWNNLYKSAYETKKFTDPDFCLLKFTAEKGREYRNFKVSDIDL